MDIAHIISSYFRFDLIEIYLLAKLILCVLIGSFFCRDKFFRCELVKFIITTWKRNISPGKLRLPFFENKKSAPILEKKALIVSILYAKFTIQNLVLIVSKSKDFSGLFFWNFWRNVYRIVLISRNLPCPEKLLVARLKCSLRIQ